VPESIVFGGRREAISPNQHETVVGHGFDLEADKPTDINRFPEKPMNFVPRCPGLVPLLYGTHKLLIYQ
jgi:hypothetical protein